jgi:hypothetical protein
MPHGEGCLVEHLVIDALVLVDGGTDILVRDDETGLATPVEDITSLAAAARCDIGIRGGPPAFARG